jgi:parallel beta-helix repeat protein
LGNCPKGKGIIVKKANYSDIHIIWDDGWDNITLVGEDGALLCQNTNTTDIITLRGSKADPLENLAISGFHFQGCNQAGSQCGIHMANTRNCIIENNYFDGMASARYTGHVAAIYLAQNCNNNRISGNTIYQGTCEGIGIGGARANTVESLGKRIPL